MQTHAVCMHVDERSDLLNMTQQCSPVCHCTSACTDIQSGMQPELWQKQSDWVVFPPKFLKAAGLLVQFQIPCVLVMYQGAMW